MPRAVIIDHEFPDLSYEHEIAEAAGAELDVLGSTDPEAVREATAGADVTLSAYSTIDRSILEGLAPGATVIRYGIGVDTIDLDAATALGVRACNVPDYGANTVADHTVTLALALARRIPEYDRALRAGEDGWIPAPEVGSIRSLEDTVYGLIGTGQIGRQVATRMQVFGCRVIAYDPYADATATAEAGIELMGLEDMLGQAHIVSVHAPLTPETHHLLDRDRMRAMPPGAIIVNTARGPLVDTVAACELLETGHLGGLGLDVFESEPLETGHPARHAERAILTPHAAYYSDRSLRNLQRYATEEMGRALRGEPLRCCVNEKALAAKEA